MRTDPPAPRTTAGVGHSQNRRISPPSPASAARSRASSRARFSSAVAAVWSKREIAMELRRLVQFGSGAGTSLSAGGRTDINELTTGTAHQFLKRFQFGG